MVSVDEFTRDELSDVVASLKELEEITWVHFEGRIPDVLEIAIPRIRNLLPHALISIEFEKPNRPGLIDLLPLADLAFFSHSYFNNFRSENHPPEPTPTEFFRSMRILNPTAPFTLTLGPNGACYSFQEEEGAVPTEEVNLVDSTGAGDTFIAGFAWAMGKLKKGVKESTELAVMLATKKVAREGFDGVWD